MVRHGLSFILHMYLTCRRVARLQTRFVNHSCSPNCDMQVWRVMGEPRLIIVANQAIPANEELTYNYGSSFEAHDGVGIRMECRCGAPNCCGVVGGNASKLAAGRGSWCKTALDLLDLLALNSNKARKVVTLKRMRDVIRQCPLKSKTSEEKFSESLANQMQDLLAQLEKQVQIWSDYRSELNAFWSAESATLEEAEALMSKVPTGMNIKRLQNVIADVKAVSQWSALHLLSEAEYARRCAGDGGIEWRLEGHEWIGEIVTRRFAPANGAVRYMDGCLVKWAPADGDDEALWHLVMFDGDEEDLDKREVREAIEMRAERQNQAAKKRKKSAEEAHYHVRFCTQVYTCPHFQEIESLLQTAKACKPMVCESAALAQQLHSRLDRWLTDARADKNQTRRQAQRLLEEVTRIPVNIFRHEKFADVVSNLMRLARWK